MLTYEEALKVFGKKISNDMYHLYMSGANDCRIDWDIIADVLSLIYNKPKGNVINRLHSLVDLDLRR